MLEVEQDSAAVDRGLDNLIKKLSSLRETVSNARGYGTTAKGIREIGEAANSLNSDASKNMYRVVGALQGLQNIQRLKISSSIATQLKNIGEATKSINGADWSGVRSLASNLAPLENIKKSAGLSSTVSAMRKLPEAVEAINTKLDDSKIAQFATRVNALRDAVVPLADEMRAVTAGFSTLPTKIQKAIDGTNRYTDANKKAYKSSGNLLKTLKSLATTYLSVRAIWNLGKESFTAANDFVESINLANVAMGEGATTAMEYAQTVEDLIGINMSDWITQVGTFNQMIAGFGVTQDKSAHMAQQLTQLGYDIQSAFNVSDLSQVMDRIQSGLAGQIKGMREYGVELSVAAMKEFALGKGITKSWTAMSQAEKTALRYAKIMEDTSNIQQDLARTINTPANSLRTLSAQWDVAKRYIGQFVSVIATKAIPIMQTCVSVISALAQTLANAWGYVLPDIPTTGVVGGLEDVEDAADNVGSAASGASKKLNGLLASWDEINVIQSESSSGGGGGSSAIQDAFDFTGLTSYSYDFLDGIKSRTQDITAKIQGITDKAKLLWPYVRAVGIGFATWKLADSVAGLIDILKGGAWTFPLTLAGTVAGFSLVYDAASTIFEAGKLELKTALEAALGFAVTTGAVALGTGSVATGFFVSIPLSAAAVLVAFALTKEKEYSQLAADAFANSATDGVSPEEMIKAVEAEFAARAGSAKLVIDAYAEVGNYKEALKEATDQIAALNNLIFGDQALTATEAEAFKSAWDTVTTTLDSISNASYNTVFAGLVEAAQSANTELAKEAEKAKRNLTAIQTGYSEWQLDLKAEMDDLIGKISRGEATSADEERYYTIFEALSKSTEDRKAELNFEQALQNAANVDYENVDSVRAYVEELQQAYKEYSGVNDSALEAFKSGIEDGRFMALTQYKLGDITKEQYDAINAQYDHMVSVYEQLTAEKNKELQEIASSVLMGVFQQALTPEGLETMDIGTAQKYITETIEPIIAAVEGSGLLTEEKVQTLRDALAELKSAAYMADDSGQPAAGRALTAFANWWNRFVIGGETAYEFADAMRELQEATFTVETPTQEELASEMPSGNILTDGITIETKLDTTNVTDGLKTVEEAASTAGTAIQDAMKDAFTFKVNVETNQFGVVTVTPTFSIPQYAEGGIPDTGSLFIANEAGPELVGQFGSGTGVANSDQIVAGITAGVSQANASQNALLREQNNLLRQLLDKEVVAKVTPSVGLGQAAQRSLDMYSRVSGVGR